MSISSAAQRAMAEIAGAIQVGLAPPRAMTAVAFCDELDFAVGWIHPEPRWMERAGHAVRSGGGVWVIDPPDGDGVEERIRALGEPAGVVQLLDRHPRDCEALASSLGVPLHVVPMGAVDGAPFEVVPVVRLPRWKESALWFEQERTLVCADVLANAPGYSAASEPVGVHPLLRLRPPGVLRRYEPLPPAARPRRGSARRRRRRDDRRRDEPPLGEDPRARRLGGQESRRLLSG